MVRLPAPAAVRLVPGAGEDEAAAAGSASTYLRHLTELRWGVAEWEHAAGSAGGGARRWVSPAGVVQPVGATSLPDLSPLLQAGRLAVVQLACVPAAAQAQLEAVRARLPALRQLQVNSAYLMG